MLSILSPLFLVTILSVQFPGGSSSCSRLLSRRVRKFLQTDIFSRLQFDPQELPLQCQLNPLHDLYYDQEEHKSSYGSRDQRCGYCGKHFKSDMYLDRHFDNKHQDMIESNRTTCLADLCPLFGCSELNTHYKGSSSRRNGGAFAKLHPCSDDEVERYVYKCEVLSKRCFGHLNDGKNGNKMMSYFNSNVCKRLHCENGVLQGHLVEEEDDDDDDINLFFNVMRWIIAFLVLVAIALYACTSGTLTPFFSKSRKPDLDKSVGQPRGILTSYMKSFLSKKD
mmetsp:Transcript_20052/g.33788  ORF Transcript_20052/g.33788 Transcript_20052/m.33788 type:complete len:280 (-) Transcript_20052:173-1012(-)